MRTFREENKKKLEELLANFPAAYRQYVSDEIDKANAARDDEEFDRIVDERLNQERYFVEYLLDNGVVFERTGHWICDDDDQGYWKCSECGFPVMAADDWCDPYEAEIEFCEKCGARMIRPENN